VQGYEFDSAVVGRVLGLERSRSRSDWRRWTVHGPGATAAGAAVSRRALTVRLTPRACALSECLYAALPAGRGRQRGARPRLGPVGSLRGEERGLAANWRCFSRRRASTSVPRPLSGGGWRTLARILAHHEAVALARRGLALVQTLPDTPERARRELPLQVTLGVQLQVTQDYAAPEAERTYARRNAVRTVRKPRRSSVLWGLWMFYLVRPDLGKSRDVAEWLFTLGSEGPGSAQLLQARQGAGGYVPQSRRPARHARTHGARGCPVRLKQHSSHTDHYGRIPEWCASPSGSGALAARLPDQAVQRSVSGRPWVKSWANPARSRWRCTSPPCSGSTAARAASRRAAEGRHGIATEHGFALASGRPGHAWMGPGEQGARPAALPNFARTDRLGGHRGRGAPYLPPPCWPKPWAGKEDRGRPGVLAEALALVDGTGEAFTGRSAIASRASSCCGRRGPKSRAEARALALRRKPVFRDGPHHRRDSRPNRWSCGPR